MTRPSEPPGRRRLSAPVLAVAFGLSVASLVGAPSGAEAQAEDRPGTDPRTRAAIGLEASLPVGEFRRFVDTGWGLGLSLVHDLTPDGVIGLRAEGSWARYGHVSRRVPFSRTVRTVLLDMDVENTISRLTVGPQLSVPLGGVRPFVHAGVGFSYLATTSSVEGTRERRDLASTTHVSDFTPALVAGGGLSLALSGGDHPVGLLVSGSYLRNGTAEYLRNEDLGRLVDGDLLVSPVTSEADLVTVRAGLEVGL